ncbi:MAG: NAD-dependent epimerase/dehydratase family protein [Gammaproteobacteria bacterium]|nr:MAG: NAD-dependent epimerase/dehydratase family protein [Gammaproteobacteria bacterium]
MSRAIVVTGAAGFIGRFVVAALRERNIPVIATGRPAGRETTGVIPVAFDDQTAMVPLLREAQAVIHLAARAHVAAHPDPDANRAFRDVNVQGTLDVARAAATAGVRRFVFVSSAGVLGARSPPGGLSDESPAAPYDAYTRSKLEAETLLAPFAAETGLELVIVRPPVVYGPNAPGNFGRLLRWVGRVPLPLGAISARRSGTGVRNLADFLAFAAITEEAGGTVCLVSDPETPTVTELCRRVATLRGRPGLLVPVSPAILAFALRLAGSRPDARRLTEPFELQPTVTMRLGWRPPYTLNDELAFAVGAKA